SSSSTGASRANGPPIDSNESCRIGYAPRRAICSITASTSGRASGVARTDTCHPGCTPTHRSTSRRAYSSTRGSRMRRGEHPLAVPLHDLAVEVQLPAAAQVLDDVPVDRAVVRPARDGVAAPEREVHGAVDLLVEERG